MADVQFQEPQYGRATGGPRRSWLAGLVIKAGLAKDDASAQKALVGVLIVTIILIALVWTI
jgi:hypothetical protein